MAWGFPYKLQWYYDLNLLDTVWSVSMTLWFIINYRRPQGSHRTLASLKIRFLQYSKSHRNLQNSAYYYFTIIYTASWLCTCQSQITGATVIRSDFVRALICHEITHKYAWGDSLHLQLYRLAWLLCTDTDIKGSTYQ